MTNLSQYLTAEKELAEKRKHQSQLQGIGWKNSVAAQELKPGQHILYNYGLRSLILAVEPKGAQSVIVTTINERGNQFNRRYKSTTLVAVDELN